MKDGMRLQRSVVIVHEGVESVSDLVALVEAHQVDGLLELLQRQCQIELELSFAHQRSDVVDAAPRIELVGAWQIRWELLLGVSDSDVVLVGQIRDVRQLA